MDKQYKPSLEPVAVVVSDYALHWIGIGPITMLCERTGVKVGSRLVSMEQVQDYIEREREAMHNAALEEAASEVMRLSSNHPITSRIRALKYHPAQPNEWTEQDALLELIHMKFQSGNDVPVERITLTRDELDYVFPGLLK